MDLSRQASLRVGAAPARSRQPVAALFIQDNELRSACPASTEPLVACAGLSYACSHGLPHSQDSPPLRSTSGYPTPRYDSSSLNLWCMCSMCDEPHGVGMDGVPDLLVEALGLQVAAQSVLDVAVLVLCSDGTCDVRDDRVASRLYPVDHVADELVQRLRETVKHFHHKIVELHSRFPRDCAIIHRAVLSFVWLRNRVLYSVRRRNGQRFAFFAMRGVFRRRGGGSPASEERKFAGVRGARSATRRLAEGNG